MATKVMYDAVKQAIQDLIAPDLERIKGQLTGVDARISALDKRVDEGLAAVRSEVASLEKRVDEGLSALRQEMRAELRTVDTRMDALKDRLDEALNIRERLAAIEVKLAALG